MADAIDDFAADVHAVANVNALIGTSYSVGMLGTEALGEYPRVVWVSDSGTVDPVDDVGARVDSGTRVRQIRTDAADVDLHIWGSDREATRAIMHALVVACWQQSHGSCFFGRYRWVTEESPRAEFATHGAKIILSLTVRFPIREDPGTLVTITTQTQTVTLDDPANP